MQIPLTEWPRGLCREIATIDPSAVVQYLGSKLIFERDHDDLDAFSAAIFVVNDTLLALQLYDNIPTGDYTLIAMSDSLEDDSKLETFLSTSGISASAVRWRRPPEAD